MISPFLVYLFLKRLTTPFEQWPAFAAGVIDKAGNVIVKARDRSTMAQRNSFSLMDRLCLNIKKVLHSLPGGSTRIASYMAALYLLKESEVFNGRQGDYLTESFDAVDMLRLQEFVETGLKEETVISGPTNTANPHHIGGFTDSRHFVRKGKKRKGDDNIVLS